MTELNAVVIADDITGASDTGNQFASRGYRTNVVFDPSAPTNCDVLVVDTETREAPPAAAYETVRATVLQHGTTLLCNKLDSTLHENVTDELAAVLDAATPDILLLAPAFPSDGWTTEDGVQLVDGDPVVETLTDSENLLVASSVVELLSSLAYPVETLPLDVVTKDTGHVRSKLAETDRNRDGPVVVVADATTHTHLRSLADAANRLIAIVAYAGSGGLAGALSRLTTVSGGQSVLGVVGSVGETSFGQLARVPDQAIVALDPGTMLERPTEAASEAVGPILAAQRAHGFAIVTSAPFSRAVDEVTRSTDALGLDGHAIKGRIATTLRAAVRGVHETRSLAGLFTTGGSTTIAVLDELDAEPLELTGIELNDGTPFTRTCGGVADEIPLVTKAGSFGNLTTIANCLDFIDTP